MGHSTSCREEDNSMNIIVTGASGFIGSALCVGLRHLGNVVGLDKSGGTLQDGTFEKVDILDYESVSNFFRLYHPDIIVHCAGIAHQKASSFDTQTYLRVNAEATEHLARIASYMNPNVHFIFLSTVSVYGEKDLITPIREDGICNPTSDYARSKLKAEQRIRALHEQGLLLRVTILRLAPVYDREWTLNLDRRVFLPGKLAYVRFGSGKQRMSALARPNLVDFIMCLLNDNKRDAGLSVMNVCDNDPYEFNKIIHVFKQAGCKPLRPSLTIPLSFIRHATRLAGIFFPLKKSWLSACYDKLASDLVFCNDKMLGLGFTPKYSLEAIFLNKISRSLWSL